MDHPDAVLALGLLYGFQGKRESRMGSVSVNGAGLGAAIFCDLVQRFYTPGPMRNANQVLMPGLAIGRPLPPDSAMVMAAVSRKNEKGEFEYVRTVHLPTDTSLPEAVIRNGVIFNAAAVMILSAPATDLAKSLDLSGTKELYKNRVKRLVIVGAGVKQQDPPALRKVLAEFPAPIYFCPKAVGDALPFPSASLDKDFAWAPAHPIVDAYKAFRPGNYDAPTYDMAAALWIVRPDKEYFQLSPEGSVQVSDDGKMQFVPGGGGQIRSLVFDPAQREAILQAYVEITSAKPPIPRPRKRFGNKAAEQVDDKSGEKK
jgi:hypothetical protein